jgi:hypothetical protein
MGVRRGESHVESDRRGYNARPMTYGRNVQHPSTQFARIALLCLVATFQPFASQAQGFGSVSSQPAGNTAAAPTAPFAAGQQATAPVPPPPRDMPAASAQIASLGFSSISGMSPTDSEASIAGSTGAAGSNRPYDMADKVVVYKGDRTLQLLRGGRVIAEYPIKLGLNPYGHKRQEGDFRTPEGRYTLVRRNPQSEFFLSMQVSYPNAEDAAVARERGVPPGGAIMIHGQPNVPKKPPEHYATRDWTDGCIALSNSDMVDVWQRTPLGTPIEIRP